MYVASIRTDEVSFGESFETCREAWRFLADRMKAESDKMYPAKEPDELAVAEIMANAHMWELAKDGEVQHYVASFFSGHGFGPDGTGSLTADGTVYEVVAA
jgi:hypothetical protein